MGWIYGNVLVGGNNTTTNSTAASYQYDKIFSNRFLMDHNVQNDGIFLGRKVLIDYNQKLIDTIPRLYKYDDVYVKTNDTFEPNQIYFLKSNDGQFTQINNVVANNFVDFTYYKDAYVLPTISFDDTAIYFTKDNNNYLKAVVTSNNFEASNYFLINAVQEPAEENSEKIYYIENRDNENNLLGYNYVAEPEIGENYYILTAKHPGYNENAEYYIYYSESNQYVKDEDCTDLTYIPNQHYIKEKERAEEYQVGMTYYQQNNNGEYNEVTIFNSDYLYIKTSAFYWVKQEEVKRDLDLVTTDFPTNGYAYYIDMQNEPNDKDDNFIFQISPIKFIKCDSEQDQGNVNTPATFTETNQLASWYNTYCSSNQTKSTIDFNKFIDRSYYGDSLDVYYDSTVWQKTYINNIEKYIMIAELNAKNPKINLNIIPPAENGLANTPILNVNGKDEYDLYMSMQPGLRVKNQPYYEVNIYRPGLYHEQGDTEKTINTAVYDSTKEHYKNNVLIQKMHFTSFPQNIKVYWHNDSGFTELSKDSFNNYSGNTYILLSDENSTYSAYEQDSDINNKVLIDNNVIVEHRKSPAAIFYNKKGLDKNVRNYFDTNIQGNSITMKFEGHSGYDYETNDYYQPITFDENNISQFANYQNNENLYYAIGEEDGYAKNNNQAYDTSRTYFIKTTVGSKPDTNELEILLPSIGNMVCEGWDMIYGPERNMEKHDYDSPTNKLVKNPNANNNTESLLGLYNHYVDKVNELRGYADDFAATQTQRVAESLPLLVTQTNGKTAVTPLEGRNLIQNQIAVNNLGIKLLAEKMGCNYTYVEVPTVTNESYQPNLYYYKDNNNNYILDGNQTFTEGRAYYSYKNPYVVVPNVTSASYQPNLYYIQNGNNYELDTTEEFNAQKTYYTCQIDDIFDPNISLQNQINTDHGDLHQRRNDIMDIVSAIGLKSSNNNYTSIEQDAEIVLEIPGNKKDGSIQGQIDRNDMDIANLLSLIGIGRNNEQIQYGNEGTIPTTVKEKTIESHLTDLYSQDADIKRYLNAITSHLEKIEAFLSEGYFLFTHGRSNKNFVQDNSTLYKTPSQGT